MIVAAAMSALAWFLIRLDERSSMAPDSLYYALMARGEKVPRPFCGRWLFPLIFRERLRAWNVMVAVMFVVGGCAMYTLAGNNLVATLLWVWLPNTRFHLRHPMLVDLPGIVLPMAAAAWAPDSLAWKLPLAFLIGATREWGVIWYAILAACPPALLAGFAGTAVGYFWKGRPGQQGDNDFITDPFHTVTRYRMGHLFNYRLMLLPWGMVLPLAVFSGVMPWHWFILAYAPLVIATDHARIYLYAAPVLILAAVQAPVPAILWGGIVLAHVFNPYRGA
jgi:hypothetical protein